VTAARNRPGSRRWPHQRKSTHTSAACPLTDVIEDQSRSALVGSGLVDDLRINWVWNPPWGPDKITEDGREQLRALGFTV